jgi:hypothetical protein
MNAEQFIGKPIVESTFPPKVGIYSNHHGPINFKSFDPNYSIWKDYIVYSETCSNQTPIGWLSTEKGKIKEAYIVDPLPEKLIIEMLFADIIKQQPSYHRDYMVHPAPHNGVKDTRRNNQLETSCGATYYPIETRKTENLTATLYELNLDGHNSYGRYRQERKIIYYHKN